MIFHENGVFSVFKMFKVIAQVQIISLKHINQSYS